MSAWSPLSGLTRRNLRELSLLQRSQLPSPALKEGTHRECCPLVVFAVRERGRQTCYLDIHAVRRTQTGINRHCCQPCGGGLVPHHRPQVRQVVFCSDGPIRSLSVSIRYPAGGTTMAPSRRPIIPSKLVGRNHIGQIGVFVVAWHPADRLLLEPAANEEFRSRFAQRIGTAGVDAHNDALAIVCTPSR